MNDEQCGNVSSENETKLNGTAQPYERNRVDWIIPTSVNIILFLITLWILISLIHYGVKTRKWSGNHLSNMDKLNAGIVYSLVVVCAVSCLCRYSMNQAFINVGFGYGQDKICETVSDILLVPYVIILLSVYLFLWFRQRVFYTNHMLAFKVTKWIKACSFGSIILITVSGIAFATYLILPRNYISSPCGCLYISDSNLRLNYGVYGSIFFTISHFILISLFVYPLVRTPKLSNSHTPASYTSSAVSSYSSSVSTNPDMQAPVPPLQRSNTIKPSNKDIKFVLKKTIIFALLSILTDTTLLLILQYSLFSHRRWTSMMFDFASFFNILYLILSFATYKHIIVSPCKSLSTNSS